MKLKKVESGLVKPKLKKAKPQPPTTKPKLKKVNKSFPLNQLKPFSTNLSCKYKGNFPWQPEMKEYDVISELDELKWLAEEMSTLSTFAFDTETNTLEVLSDNKNFKCVGISISWGEENTYYIPTGHVRDEDIDNQLTIDVVVKYLRPIFENPNVRIFGWNLRLVA